MKNSSTLFQLLEMACPSIRYRCRLEIMGHEPDSHGMSGLQAEILEDELVMKVLGWQQLDGWLGCDFHGYGSIEAGIRILCEKGVRHDHPVLSAALDALERGTDRLHLGIGKVGKVLDDLGFGGSLRIRAAVYTYSDMEAKPFVKTEIYKALECFKAVMDAQAISEIVENFQGKLVFKPGVLWPDIYALRLLAATQSWRTLENQQKMIASIRRLIELSPIPDIHVRHKSQKIAPGSFSMHDFNPDLNVLDDAGWMRWFHRMEMLARLGIVNSIPELQNQIHALRQILNDGDGWFSKRLSHSSFNQWGAYSGLMLERDWRSPKRRMYDLTFRSLLISRYAGKDDG